MEVKKGIVLVFLVLIMSSNAFAFDFFGLIGNFFSSIFSNNNSDIASNVTLIEKNSIRILDVELNKKDFINLINKEILVTDNLKLLKNNCYLIEIVEKEKFVLKVNNEGEVTNIYENLPCTQTIQIKNELLVEIVENGFVKENLPTYISRIDLNPGLYMDLLKLI